MFKARTCIGIGLVLAAMTACGDNGGVTIDDFAAKAIEARCERDVACGFEPDQATCEATALDPSVHHTHAYDTLVADVGNGRIKYDSAAAERCFDSVRADTCELPGAQPTAGSLDCFHAFQGTVAMGGTCFIDEECVEGYLGACTVPTTCSPNTCCAGTCAGPVVYQLPIGAVCDDPDFELCAPGSYCKRPPGGPGTCTALIEGEGAPCEPTASFDGCANPRYCDEVTSTCKSPPELGASCDPLGVPCHNERAYCDHTSKKCVADVPVGGACPDVFTSCVGLATCMNGTCVAFPKLGEACTPDGPACLGSAACIDGTCQVMFSSTPGACPAP